MNNSRGRLANGKGGIMRPGLAMTERPGGICGNGTDRADATAAALFPAIPGGGCDVSIPAVGGVAAASAGGGTFIPGSTAIMGCTAAAGDITATVSVPMDVDISTSSAGTKINKQIVTMENKIC